MAVIKAVVQTENAATLKETANLYVLDALLTRALQEPTYCCLRFVDPYGDTIFNQLQLPVLLKEWEHLTQLSSNDAERHAMQAVRDLLEYCLAEPHRYLRFYGD
jgi:hypothetical protein